ncbi:hypothetical protein QE177_08745 [Arsenophonus sp. aPb]|uniref:hypothetical protein n=1 Tax=Arsenophonus sp. aPb TaxID=3041619 RepID=UPI002469A37A|nr:hypothetical protein [Arsenophonus sp. aPb]WGL97313.1 hypothetical protein QE177_08745 [Arsenophonus sp. aPb]
MLNIKRLLLVTSVDCDDRWKYLSSKAKALFDMAIRHKSKELPKNQLIKLYYPSAWRVA